MDDKPRVKKAPGGDAWVRYVGRHAAVTIAATGQKVSRGESVAVSAELADGLLAQTTNWKKAKAPKPAPAAEKEASAEEKQEPEEGDTE